MPFMPGFRKHKTDACYVGRIIAGYGEFEILFCNSAGYGLAVRRSRQPGTQIGQHRIRYENIARHKIHLVSGAERRLTLAKKLARPAFQQANLQKEFQEIFRAINLCRETRNLLAHSSWDYSKEWTSDRVAGGRRQERRRSIEYPNAGCPKAIPALCRELFLGSFSGSGNDQSDLRGQERIASTP